MSVKRSRADYEDSDDEVPAFGRQILPVANLPATFSAEPADGLEYLFTVRRDAKTLPHVTRVANPYDTVTSVLPTAINYTDSAAHPSLPSSQWRETLIQRFNNLRKNAFKRPTDVQQPMSQLMPALKERDRWWAFLSGKSEFAWNPPKKPPKQRKIKRVVHDDTPQESLTEAARPHNSIIEEAAHAGGSHDTHPKEPEVKLVPRILTPTLLHHIDERIALHILMYFAHWINLHLDEDCEPFPRLADAHAQWIFFLLTRVDDHVSADDMAMLRSLVRGCLGLLKVMHREETREDGLITEVSCWIIASTIIGVWKQQDLWKDAEDVVKTLES